MNAPQAAKLNRYNVVITQLSNETAAIASVPAAKRTLDQFVAKVAAINSIIPRQGQKSTPITHAKAGARALLVSSYFDLAALVSAWADEQGHTTFRDTYDLSFTHINHMKDSVLPNEARDFYQFLVTHKTELADHGISGETLEDFAQAINSFSEAATLPRTTITTRSTQVKNLADLFAEADHLLRDRLMKQLVIIRKSYRDVYNTFLSNCKVINTATASAKNKAAKAARQKQASDNHAAINA